MVVKRPLTWKLSIIYAFPTSSWKKKKKYVLKTQCVQLQPAVMQREPLRVKSIAYKNK